MIKRLRRLSTVLKILGIFILVYALILSVIVHTTTNAPWKEMQKLASGSSVDITKDTDKLIPRQSFNRSYLAALLEADNAQNRTLDERRESLKTHFTWISEKADANDRRLSEAQLASTIAEFTEGRFDADAYTEHYEAFEERRDAVKIDAAFKYIDSLKAPQKGAKGGLKSLSGERDNFEKYYDALLETYSRHEIGSFAQFSEACAQMLKTLRENGSSITPQEFLASGFDIDEYYACLESIREADSSEGDDTVIDEFAQLTYAQLDGEQPDYESFFKSSYAEFCEEFGQDAAAYELYVPALASLLHKANFDGSFAAVKAEADALAKARASASFDKNLTSYCNKIITRSKPAEFFLRTGRVSYLILLLGILLIVSNKLIKKYCLNLQIKTYEHRTQPMSEDALLKVDHLCQYFGANKAVDDVSFEVKKGEVFGLVGESGCGKTTTGRSIIKLYDITSGNIYFKGMRIAAGTKKLTDELVELKKRKKNASDDEKQNINARIRQLKEDIYFAKFDHKYCDSVHASEIAREVDEKFAPLLASAKGDSARTREIKKQYAKEKRIARKQHYVTKIQMIFQDPIASLDPRMTVREIIAEGLRIRGETNEKVIDEKVYNMLETVGLVREHAGRYPHEFSGGQKQRIGVARAVVMNPEMIIADEPVSALDVSIQAQVINLLDELRHRMGLTVMFIAHDLSVVKYFSDRIGVMYYGKLVELASSDELFAHPLHPYTRSLLSAIPLPDPEYEKHRVRIKYDPLQAHDYSVQKPEMHEILPGHFVYCNDIELQSYRKELGIENK